MTALIKELYDSRNNKHMVTSLIQFYDQNKYLHFEDVWIAL